MLVTAVLVSGHCSAQPECEQLGGITVGSQENKTCSYCALSMDSSKRKGRYPETRSHTPRGQERKSLAVISNGKLEEELLGAQGLDGAEARMSRKT